MRRILLPLTLALVVLPKPSQALPISDFLRRPANDQRSYAAGAASMLAFTEGMNNRAARTTCIADWYTMRGADQLFTAL